MAGPNNVSPCEDCGTSELNADGICRWCAARCLVLTGALEHRAAHLRTVLSPIGDEGWKPEGAGLRLPQDHSAEAHRLLDEALDHAQAERWVDAAEALAIAERIQRASSPTIHHKWRDRLSAKAQEDEERRIQARNRHNREAKSQRDSLQGIALAAAKKLQDGPGGAAFHDPRKLHPAVRAIMNKNPAVRAILIERGKEEVSDRSVRRYLTSPD